jgi:hypothetical protein
MTEWVERLSAEYVGQVLTGLYFATPRDRALAKRDTEA